MVREQVMLAVAASDHLAPGDERLSRLFRADPQFAGLRNADGSINRDLLTAQGALKNAELAVAQAQATALQAYHALLAATGRSPVQAQ
jgi:hypothetical protein